MRFRPKAARQIVIDHAADEAGRCAILPARIFARQTDAVFELRGARDVDPGFETIGKYQAVLVALLDFDAVRIIQFGGADRLHDELIAADEIAGGGGAAPKGLIRLGQNECKQRGFEKSHSVYAAVMASRLRVGET